MLIIPLGQSLNDANWGQLLTFLFSQTGLVMLMSLIVQ